jgi:ribonuclease HI
VKKLTKKNFKQLKLSLDGFEPLTSSGSTVESVKQFLEIYIDGASRGNPGMSGVGVLIKDKDGNIYKIKRNLGILTNNQAEYEALITALQSARELKKKHLKIYTDSSLLANQINGNWRVRDSKIAVLCKKAKELIAEFGRVEIEHISRELNREADKLANIAIDEYS